MLDNPLYDFSRMSYRRMQACSFLSLNCLVSDFLLRNLMLPTTDQFGIFPSFSFLNKTPCASNRRANCLFQLNYQCSLTFQIWHLLDHSCQLNSRLQVRRQSRHDLLGKGKYLVGKPSMRNKKQTEKKTQLSFTQVINPTLQRSSNI